MLRTVGSDGNRILISLALVAGWATPVEARVTRIVIDLDTTKATLTKRPSEEGAIIPIASAEWAFGDCGNAIMNYVLQDALTIHPRPA